MEAEELQKMAEEGAEGKLTPFDRYVAMTMAIIAALLAVTTMLGHRAHTETLSLQEEANRLRTEANIYHTRASDQWAFYQAKNIRSAEYEGFIGLLDALGKTGFGADRKSQELSEQWASKVRRYEGTELPQLKADAEKLVAQARGMESKSEEAIQRSYDAHRHGERFDLAELGAELALVLCSLAVLTKGKSFWYSGIGAAMVGLAIALSAMLMA